MQFFGQKQSAFLKYFICHLLIERLQNQIAIKTLILISSSSLAAIINKFYHRRGLHNPLHGQRKKNSIKRQGNGTCFRCNIFSWEIDISHTIVAVSHIIIKRLLIRISLSYICSQIGGRITRDETIMTASAYRHNYHPSPSTWENWNEKNTTTFLGTASILGQGIHGMEKIPKNLVSFTALLMKLREKYIKIHPTCTTSGDRDSNS